VGPTQEPAGGVPEVKFTVPSHEPLRAPQEHVLHERVSANDS
jgi:hypothetical protein